MKTKHPAPETPGRWPWAVLVALMAVLLTTLLGLLGAHSSVAAPLPPTPVATPVAAGGGEYVIAEGDELSEENRAEIIQTIDANIRQLTSAGRLSAPRSTAAIALDWPLLSAPDFSDPGYHAVTGYVDHNPAFPGQLQDFACGQRTYDTGGGYNHAGTDYYLWPFAWNKMAAGDVSVVAAAPGVIINKSEGNPDQSCSFNSNKWNAVYVRHEDGSIAWYGHLKQGSVTTKPIGATVFTGEYLGQVGSSGNSTGPHLHLELHDASYQLIDPYAGSCNTRSAASWWRVQRPYDDSAVNKVMTGSAPVSFQSCPSPDITYEATSFQAGDTIYFTTFYRDQADSQTSTYRLLRPDGSVYVEWSHTSDKPFYKLSYWWWAFELGADQPTGTWTFEVEFEGTVTHQSFNLNASAAGTPQPTASPQVTPTPQATTTPQATPTGEASSPSPTPTATRPAADEQPNRLFLPVVSAG
jgi:murein DD-endopeptidase MepM/ murein hydrolase activator NlpD